MELATPATPFAHFQGADFASVASVNPPVANFITSLPNFHTFEWGDKTKQAVLSKVVHATPGGTSLGNLFCCEKSYLSLFFSSFVFSVYEWLVDGQISYNWGNFAVALQCQSMYYNTKITSKRLNINSIDNALNTYNDQVTPMLFPLYSQVLRYGLFASNLAALSNFNAAKTDYIKYLKSPTFIQSRRALYQNGNWNGGYYGSPAWEMFHHYLKLRILGASDAEITSLISTMESLGLPVISETGSSTWKLYKDFMYKRTLGIRHTDIDQTCATGQMKTVWIPTYSPYSSGAMIEEGASSDFIANGQPGASYRNPPPKGSCFAANTKVVMANGSTKNIQSIVSGDSVATPAGPWTVLALVNPPRRGRTLYSINGATDIQFTGSHPLINKTPGKTERFLSVNPQQLKDMVPLTGDVGVLRLQPGTAVGSWNSASGVSPLLVQAVNEHMATNPSEVVYDVLLVPDSNLHTPGYIVQSASGVSIVAASELPQFDVIPAATMAIAQVLSHSLDDLAAALSTVSSNEAEYDLHVQALEYGINTNIVSHSDKIRDVSAPVAPNADSLIDHIQDALFSGSTTYSNFRGEVYDQLFGSLVESILTVAELDPDVHHVNSSHPATGDMDLQVSIISFDAGLIPGVYASDLNTIVGKWYDEDGEENPDQFILSSANAKYSSKFKLRFYQTYEFPDYNPNATHPHKLEFEFNMQNNIKLKASHYFPSLDTHSSRLVSAVVHHPDNLYGSQTGRLELLLRLVPSVPSMQKTMTTSATSYNDHLVHSIGEALEDLSSFSDHYFNYVDSLN